MKIIGSVILFFVALGCNEGKFNSERPQTPPRTKPGDYYPKNDPKSSLNDIINDFIADNTDTHTTTPNGLNIDKFSVKGQSSGDSDVIFIIDTSDSMSDEIDKVEANLNSFATKLANDNRTSNYQLFVLAGKDDNKFTPPAIVLNNPRFTYEDQNHKVRSNNALNIAKQFLEGTIKTPKLQLRADSIKHFIFVTDDQANTDQGGITEQTFRQYLTTSQKNSDLHFHGIICPNFDLIGGCVTRGAAYYNLAGDVKYKGITADLRTYNWTPIFNALATDIVTSASPNTFGLTKTPTNPSAMDVFINGNKLTAGQFTFANGKVTINQSLLKAGDLVVVVYP